MNRSGIEDMGLSINVDFDFHYLLLEPNVSIACRYVGGGWGKQVEFCQNSVFSCLLEYSVAITTILRIEYHYIFNAHASAKLERRCVCTTATQCTQHSSKLKYRNQRLRWTLKLIPANPNHHHSPYHLEECYLNWWVGTKVFSPKLVIKLKSDYLRGNFFAF